jgi:hypothetical protein
MPDCLLRVALFHSAAWLSELICDYADLIVITDYNVKIVASPWGGGREPFKLGAPRHGIEALYQ